ncbi:J domain-containing protein [Psidium guajava]|nr:J domain-containing protein [Psidium guajava]
MKMKPLVWLFFIVSAQTSLILAVECFSDPSISTHTTVGEKVRASCAGLNETGGFSENADGRPAISVTRKGSKGKGAYGGANLVHRPPRARNAALSSAAPPFLVSLAMLATFSLVCPCRF